jgi:hypothetical protein
VTGLNALICPLAPRIPVVAQVSERRTSSIAPTRIRSSGDLDISSDRLCNHAGSMPAAARALSTSNRVDTVRGLFGGEPKAGAPVGRWEFSLVADHSSACSSDTRQRSIKDQKVALEGWGMRWSYVFYVSSS